MLWPNRPYIDLFGIQIYWYAIIIVLGMFSAFLVISLLFKRRNLSPDMFMTIFVISLPIAIVTTRLFYCMTDAELRVQPWLWFDFNSIR